MSATNKKAKSKGPGMPGYSDREWALMDFGRCRNIALRALRKAKEEKSPIAARGWVGMAREWGKTAREVYARAFPERVPTQRKAGRSAHAPLRAGGGR
ncbi:hypothetical protein HNQ64_002496 [Prosthecobacter dejongeii]|uniref:Uncharacterized protein n=1 Tax=Prosthecobacter dejongeii TaxID=48465 RepID=A0A7W8DQA7_9BACT|nr:hypothetical protein [Prosthecobacter dejongeii]